MMYSRRCCSEILYTEREEGGSRQMLPKVFGCTLSLIYLSRLQTGEKVTDKFSVLRGPPPVPGRKKACRQRARGTRGELRAIRRSLQEQRQGRRRALKRRDAGITES